ncbi:stage V sporulation protein AC [bacterium]|nr:stage V sporulation protein AC [bacterium]
MKLGDKEAKEYKKTVRKEMPISKHFSTMAKAFICGGIICSIGQFISDMLKMWLKTSPEEIISGFTTMILITLTGILTGFGVYDKIGAWGGAGSIVPITGFANSIVSPAIEHKREGVVLGLCSNLFSIAGPVIVFGITASIIVGIIYLFI